MSGWIFLGLVVVWALWPLFDSGWWDDPESF
jgi:hypothetical protein